eukprot:gene15594-18526_t
MQVMTLEKRAAVMRETFGINLESVIKLPNVPALHAATETQVAVERALATAETMQRDQNVVLMNMLIYVLPSPLLESEECKKLLAMVATNAVRLREMRVENTMSPADQEITQLTRAFKEKETALLDAHAAEIKKIDAIISHEAGVLHAKLLKDIAALEEVEEDWDRMTAELLEKQRLQRERMRINLKNQQDDEIDSIRNRNNRSLNDYRSHLQRLFQNGEIHGDTFDDMYESRLDMLNGQLNDRVMDHKVDWTEAFRELCHQHNTEKSDLNRLKASKRRRETIMEERIAATQQLTAAYNEAVAKISERYSKANLVAILTSDRERLRDRYTDDLDRVRSRHHLKPLADVKVVVPSMLRDDDEEGRPPILRTSEPVQATVAPAKPTISVAGRAAMASIVAKRKNIQERLEEAKVTLANLRKSGGNTTKKELEGMPQAKADALLKIMKDTKKAANQKTALDRSLERLEEKQKIIVYFYETRQSLPLLTVPSGGHISAIGMQAIKYFETLRTNNNRGEVLMKNLNTIFSNGLRNMRPELHLFGSSSNGLAFHNSDLDISLLTDKSPDVSKATYRIANLLRQHQYKDVIAITRTRVPIVRFVEPTTQLSCDISINNPLAIYNSRMVKEYLKVDARVLPMIFAIKYWSKQRDINDASMHSLHSYSYVNMIIHFLQRREIGVLPCLQHLALGGVTHANGRAYGDGRVMRQEVVDGKDVRYYPVNDKVATFGTQCTMTLGQLLYEFFKYYARTFDYENTISVRTGGIIKEKVWDDMTRDHYLKIEDPFDTSFNIARSIQKAHHMATILQEFERAYEILSKGGPLGQIMEQRVAKKGKKK